MLPGVGNGFRKLSESWRKSCLGRENAREGGFYCFKCVCIYAWC